MTRVNVVPRDFVVDAVGHLSGLDLARAAPTSSPIRIR